MRKGCIKPSLKRHDDETDEQKVAARWMKRLKREEAPAYQGTLQHPYFGGSFLNVIVARKSWTGRHSHSMIIDGYPESPVQVLKDGKTIRIMDAETLLKGEETSNGVYKGIVLQFGKPGGIFHLKVGSEAQTRPWRHERGKPVSNEETDMNEPEEEPQQAVVASQNSKVIIKLRPKAAPAKNELPKQRSGSDAQANDGIVVLPKKMPRSKKNKPEDPFMQSWASHCNAVQHFFTEQVGARKHADQLFQILARHSARLGKDGVALERCVRSLITKHMANDELEFHSPSREVAEAWGKLQTPGGEKELNALKKTANNAYSQGGRTAATDLMLRKTFELKALLGQEVLAIPMGGAVPKPPERPCLSDEKGAGDLLLVPIMDLRFAHNDQSEHFAHADVSSSILQLAVELVTGLKQVGDIPIFTVCRHDNNWYCRSGNRRLAALVLASIFAPERIHCVWVQTVPLDKIFLKGRPGGRPKFTTCKNDSEAGKCEGRWLIVKETGEMIGHANVLTEAPYGADLLSLLCF